MSNLLDSIAALPPEKRDLLMRRRKEKAGKSRDLSGQSAASAKGPVPLSFTQQRVWFFYTMDPLGHSYNMPRALRLKGRLDYQALGSSLNEIMRRHDVLRTTYAVVNEQPVQIVAPAGTLPLSVIDHGKLPESERYDRALRDASDVARQPFDLERGPVLRSTLLRLDDEDHILLVIMHHIITDGWSIGVFFREMVSLYEAFSAGNPSPLPELPVQYAGFAIWQREYLQGEVLQSQLSFWKEQLGGGLPLLQLPCDRPRPPVQSFNGSERVFVLRRELTQAIKALTKQEGVTLFMVMLAAFEALLNRYTRQARILIGCPIANRPRPEYERLLGLFANTVVLGADLSGDPTFMELLRQVRETALGVYANQDLPFERLVEELQPDRDPSHSVIFQVLFALQNVPIPDLKMAGLDVSFVHVESGNSRFDLSLYLTDWPEGLTGTLEYSKDLFDRSSITRMIERFQILLESIVANPNERISRLALLTAGEKEEMPRLNQTLSAYARQSTVDDLIEAQVERTPDAVAVSFEDRRISYRELNAKANQVAHYLRSIGVRPETLVGIYMNRSIEIVFALLGVLKAGAAYVPLDSIQPMQRLRFMMEDAALSAILTEQGLQNDLPEPPIRVCIGARAPILAGLPVENPVTETDPENLAYVIYTSGSTGRPKGVQISHRAVVNFLETMKKHPGMASEDVIAAVTTISFDIAGLEVLLPLTVGAQVRLIGREEAADGMALAQRLDQYQASIMQATPATWRLLIEAGWKGGPALKALCGGEALNRDLAEEMLARCGCLWNMYGPTETTIWSTVYPLKEAEHTPPIGRPIANTETYILDEGKELVPLGLPGELHIGGEGLSRGYMNRPGLTAEKFVPDGIGGGRIYATGDLARYLPDGAIEYLGRIDSQVKLRGYRIELGEIEAILEKHESIKQAAVMIRNDGGREERLAAYVVLKDTDLDTNEIRSYLRERLPEYMAPSAFVSMERLPMTASGKVDRKALPKPDDRNQSHEIRVAPRNSIEHGLVEIWREILGIEEIGIEDDFFDLGGHSLLGLRLMWRLRERFGANLPVSVLFRARTIAELAGLISSEGDQHGAAASIVVSIKAGRGTPPLFCVHPAGGHVMIYNELSAHLPDKQTIFGIQSRALDQPENEYESVEQMAEAYAAEVKRHQPRGPYYLLGWSMGGVLAVSVSKALEGGGDEVGFVGLVDANESIHREGERGDELAGLALAFGGGMADALLSLSEDEQRALEAEFIALEPKERVKRATKWGQDRGLLPDFPAEIFERRVILTNRHLALLRGHRAPTIQAGLCVWWAGDKSQKNRTDWTSHTKGAVHAETVQGNHFSVMSGAHCEELAGRIRERLVMAQEIGPGFSVVFQQAAQ